MSDIEYILVDSSGEETPVFLSVIGSDLFRLEGSFGIFGWELDPEEVPEGAGMGWLITADRIDETRLQLREIREDPDVETLSQVLLPEAFLDSHDFAEFCEQILTAGGNWEVIMRGVFSSWVPRGASMEKDFGLRNAVNSAVDRWTGEGP